MKEDSSQDAILKYIKNSIKQNKLSHAYLIDINNNINALDIVKNIANTIYGGVNNEIDNNLYLNIKIIDPKKNYIGKDEIIELEKNFVKKGTNNHKMIYIINDCDKMNLSSSNTILKFLEEPPQGVVAILATNNISNVLETIKSRCQILKLKNENNLTFKTEEDLFYSIFPLLSKKLSYDEIKLIVNNALEFIIYLINNNKKNNLIFGRKYIDEIIENELIKLSIKEKIDIILKLSLYFLYDILKIRYNEENKILYSFMYNKVINCSKIISEKNIENKILCILKCIEINKYNVNNNLFIDNIIIGLE